MPYSEKEEQMKVEFDQRVYDAIASAMDCPVDVEMLNYIVPNLIERADKKTGMTFALICGKRIELVLFYRRENLGSEYLLVSVPGREVH